MRYSVGLQHFDIPGPKKTAPRIRFVFFYSFLISKTNCGIRNDSYKHGPYQLPQLRIYKAS